MYHIKQPNKKSHAPSQLIFILFVIQNYWTKEGNIAKKELQKKQYFNFLYACLKKLILLVEILLSICDPSMMISHIML